MIGKDKLKALIKKDGGSATGFSGLTNVLVVKDNPGQKKVLEAHEPKLTIADYDRHNDIIHRVWCLPMIKLVIYHTFVFLPLSSIFGQI